MKMKDTDKNGGEECRLAINDRHKDADKDKDGGENRIKMRGREKEGHS